MKQKFGSENDFNLLKGITKRKKNVYIVEEHMDTLILKNNYKNHHVRYTHIFDIFVKTECILFVL